MTNNARAYETALTSEDYALSCIEVVRQSGIHVDTNVLIRGLLDAEEG